MRRAGRVGREHARIILRVTGGVLHVARGGDRVAREVPLAAIRDVELDRKTIIVVGSSRTSTEVFSDRTSARIQLLVDHGEPVRLADEFVHYDYCVQHFGKVRSFLRTHGWEPEGERTSAV